MEQKLFIGLPKMHGRIRIGLPKMHVRIRIGLPKVLGRFRIGPHQVFHPICPHMISTVGEFMQEKHQNDLFERECVFFLLNFISHENNVLEHTNRIYESKGGGGVSKCCRADEGGGGVGEMLTMADKGGRGVWEMLTMADEGGREGLDPPIFG